MYGVLSSTPVCQVLDVESYSLYCCLPVLLWLPSWYSWGGMRLFNSEDPNILKYNLCSIFFFRCPARKSQTNKQNPKNCNEAKTKVLGFICRNLLGFSILLISCSAFCSLLYSLLPSFLLFWVRLLVSFLPHRIFVCKLLSFPVYFYIPFTYHSSYHFIYLFIYLFVCLFIFVYFLFVWFFSSFPVYLFDWIFGI